MNLTRTRSFESRSRKRISRAMGKKIFWKLVVTRISCKEKNGKMRKYALTNICSRLIREVIKKNNCDETVRLTDSGGGGVTPSPA